MVNVLKFQTLFSFYSMKNNGFRGLNSQNACQNSKQGRPWSDYFWRSSLFWVCPLCLGCFGRHLVFKILEHFRRIHLNCIFPGKWKLYISWQVAHVKYKIYLLTSEIWHSSDDIFFPQWQPLADFKISNIRAFPIFKVNKSTKFGYPFSY